MAANVTDVFVEHIQKWLDEEMKKDAQLADKVQAGSKTVEMACNYVLSEVKKSGRCGFDDAEVYGMVRHFFDEDDLQDPGEQDVQRIVVPEHIELSEQEKAEAREKALEAYRNEQIAKIRREAEEKEKKEKERLAAQREKRKEQQQAQLDLFGGL